MKHARPDYDRIQDPEHKIPEDEPVFLLRAQDMNAPATVLYWVTLAQKNGASDDILDAACDQSDRMRNWQAKHGRKIPDMPKG